MRYLFGDSTPFPLPFDFLRTLEAFMEAGTRVIQLDHRAQRLADEAFSARIERAQGLEKAVQLHSTVLAAIAESGAPTHALAAEYAKKLTQRATGLLNEQRNSVDEANERDDARVSAERDRANTEIEAHLRKFFQVARLPTLSTRLFTSLVEGRPDARASLVHPGNIGVSFTLSTARAPAWGAARKVADLIGPTELLLSIKKSWIGNKVTLEPMRLDDWVVGSADISDAVASIALRRKPDQKDAVVFRLKREQGRLSAMIDRPGDPNASLVPPIAEPSDLPHLDRMWTALAGKFDDIIEERAAITAVSLDGEDVLKRGLGQKLVERLVSVLAPTALEVARRSPNASELSLKREAEGGRREELYLKREQLVVTLEPLPRDGRAVFAPLGLDEWVPAETARPPQVSLVDEISSFEIDEG
jgi:hypothetical protein